MNLTSLTISTRELLNTVLSSYVNTNNVEDNSSGSENKEENFVKKKPGRKPIIGG